MNFQFKLPNIPHLIARLKLVISHPKLCWDTIASEEATPQLVANSVIIPLSLVAIVAPVIGHKIFGVEVEYFGLWKAPLFSALINQTLEIAMMITALFIDAWIIHKLAAQFHRTVSFDRAFAMVTYSAIPLFLTWGLGIFPGLLHLKPLAVAFCFYLLFFGFDKMIQTNANAPANDSKPAFFSAALAIILIVHIVMQGLVAPLTPTPFINILR